MKEKVTIEEVAEKKDEETEDALNRKNIFIYHSSLKSNQQLECECLYQDLWHEPMHLSAASPAVWMAQNPEANVAEHVLVSSNIVHSLL